MTASEDDSEPGLGPAGDALPREWDDEYLLAGLVDAITFQCRVVGGYLRRNDTIGPHLRDAIEQMRADINVQVVTDLWRA